jgi:mono/diheme cytochrome c family protein
MRRILKWLGLGVGTLVLLALVAGGGVYVASQSVIERKYEVPLGSIEVPSDTHSLLKGERLAAVYGCTNSCHGKQMEGVAPLFNEPALATFNAPNLTRMLREYSDAELERMIRRGVKRDGTSTWLMPSAMFARMTDEDLGAIIAYVRSVPVREGGADRYVSFGPMGRLGLALGKFKPLAEQIDPALKPASKTDRSDPLAFGEYLVKTSCTECHGANLEGAELLKAPSLAVIAGYDDAAFNTLMRTGIGIGNRKLGLMTEVGETRFPRMTDAEVNAMRDYLRKRFAVPADVRSASEPQKKASNAG